MSQRPPEPTRCTYCGTVAAEWICHICKRVKHDPEGIVGIAALIVGCIYLALTAGGFA